MTTAIVIYEKQIQLTKRGKQKSKHFVSVGYWWFDFLNQWKWFLHRTKNTLYAVSSFRTNQDKQCIITIHRLIMNPSQEKLIDHEDRNGLNCHEYNLRESSKSQNGANRRAWGASQYLGVYFLKKKNKWRADITINSKHIYIGIFKTEIEAAKAYDEKAIKFHGKFANLNFKQSETPPCSRVS